MNRYEEKTGGISPELEPIAQLRQQVVAIAVENVINTPEV